MTEDDQDQGDQGAVLLEGPEQVLVILQWENVPDGPAFGDFRGGC